MFDAILFDNDGILVDTEKLYFLATRQVLKENGVLLNREMFREFFLQKNSGAWHLIDGATDEDIVHLRKKRHLVYADMLAGGVPLIPGVEDTVRALAQTFTLGIVTSSRKDHFDLIHQTTHILQHFSFILTREDYARSKPDPEPYLLAVQKTGVPTTACIAVEDSQRGLLAAHAAKIPCAVIPTAETKGSDFSEATWMLNDITELLSVFPPTSRKITIGNGESLQ
ncbi:MAG: HAD family phosphatase [Deltaproteobacteria bacterium]|nr:HAD family phosphatase [Deltaproteobacteria bacterium]